MRFHNIKQLTYKLLLLLQILFLISAGKAWAQSLSDYISVPPLSVENRSEPLIMLALSNDHQLFFEAYTNYEDLDGDGNIDVSYNHNVQYDGYFDRKKCYKYFPVGRHYFGPTANAPVGGDGPDGEPVPFNQYCEQSEEWSGNFLNWATMTRIDLVRFALYGGYRSTDTADTTVLERAYLPNDGHSFVKYYSGSDIAKLTGHSFNNEISICNTTKHYNSGSTTTVPTIASTENKPSQHQHIRDMPPLMRVVEGNYSMWAGQDRYQCLFGNASEGGTPTDESVREYPVWGAGADFGQNFNNPSITGINAADKSPSLPAPLTLGETDYRLRVMVCGENHEGGVHDTDGVCKKYVSNATNKKPIGLLQEFGGSGSVKFGLMTGSYIKNKTAGVLRKNVSSIADEINSDGTFKVKFNDDGSVSYDGNLVEVGSPASDSIIASLSALRIVDYEFKGEPGLADDEAYYWGNYNRTCAGHQNSFTEGACRNWGNPFSELLAESYRYFSFETGDIPNPKVDGVSAEETLLPGLTVASWEDPLANVTNSSCVNLNVIGFNASSVSYDDSLYGETISSLDLGSSSDTVNDLTNAIGTSEGLYDPGKKYFVGKIDPASGDGQCTAKSITALAKVRGTCPDSPRLDGSYLSAGLAHYVHTNDIRSEAGVQTIETFGVTLAGNLPVIQVKKPNPTPGGNLFLPEDIARIVPSCRNSTTLGNCALVDFRPAQPQSLETVTNIDGVDQEVYRGIYTIGWEDSEQGGDYDQDLIGIIDYRLSLNGSTLEVLTTWFSQSTKEHMLFGFSLSGSQNKDGLYFPVLHAGESGDNDNGQFDYLQCGTLADADCNVSADNKTAVLRFALANNIGASSSSSSSSSASTSSSSSSSSSSGNALVGYLEPPLWYASKWGSFKEKNGTPGPDLASEWDEDGDGQPDAYTNVTNIAEFKSELRETFNAVINRTGTGTSAAISSNSVTGEGLMVQSLFSPEYIEVDNNDNPTGRSVQWVGTLNGLFIDSKGRLREDSDGNQRLTGVDPNDSTVKGDKVVELVFDAAAQRTLVNLYPLDADGNTDRTSDVDTGLEIEKIKPIWSARDQLASFTNSAVRTNRGSYTDSADSGRYILTAFDKEGAEIDPNTPIPDGLIEGSEEVPFTTASVENVTGFSDLFGTDDTDHAKNIVNYIRGDDSIAGFRNRTVNWGTGDKVWRLGDIVNSTAAVVGRPSEAYDLIYGDESYRAFKDYHRNRRQVVYVGANDGMLHAFNAGFFDASTTAFSESATGKTAHPLGSELWAYVPYNLLPHLKWLTQSDYQHVSYVDSRVQTFDVNIFTPSADKHVNGWGTILVVGMRFGGGDYTVGSKTLRSSYMVFDVTNPEEAPTLIAEVTDEDLGFTVGTVDVITVRKPEVSTGNYGSPSQNKWLLVFGSGPQGADALQSGTSDSPAKLFTLDLKEAREGNVSITEIDVYSTGTDTVAGSFVGGLDVVDWNRDYADDRIYFGLVENRVDNNSDNVIEKGRLMQATLTTAGGIDSVNQLLTGVNLPFSMPPLALADAKNNYWVYAGTGKFLVRDDLSVYEQNSYFGLRVKDSNSTTIATEVDAANLFDVTALRVFQKTGEKARVRDENLELIAAGVDTVDDFARHLSNLSTNKGWRRDFITSGENNTTRTNFVSDTLIIGTFYPPGTSECVPVGKSRLYLLDMMTGLPQTSLASSPLILGEPLEESGDLTGFIEVNPGSEQNLGYETDAKIIGDGDIMRINDRNEKVTDEIEPEPMLPVRRGWREISTDELQ